MVSGRQSKLVSVSYLLAFGTILVPFGGFLTRLWEAGVETPEFSHGILIPVIVSYLLWTRRAELRTQQPTGSAKGMVVVIVGCGLHVLGSLSGTLLISGVGFAIAVAGVVLYLWGPACLQIVAVPTAFLILMVPLPSYVLGELSWRLQASASTVSSAILRFLGVPVFQDGNLLRIVNYVLEVKQACSGSRSIFALLALALLLGMTAERRWWTRSLLVGAAPALAIGANIIRIVGTGLIASRWGGLAANESLHAAWGVLVFVLAVSGLVGFQRLLTWATNEYA
jgi:exosortase